MNVVTDTYSRRGPRARRSSTRRLRSLVSIAFSGLVLFAGLTSCTLLFGPLPVPEAAPPSVRTDALTEAIRYIGMEYEWGGQDFMPRGIDCSGLVVNVYYYAAANNGYSLPFSDATAAGLQKNWTVSLEAPEPGDLIFMGAADEAAITHVAVYESTAGGVISFIDSTWIPELGVDGVSRRSYPTGDTRFKGYGRLLVVP